MCFGDARVIDNQVGDALFSTNDDIAAVTLEEVGGELEEDIRVFASFWVLALNRPSGGC